MGTMKKSNDLPYQYTEESFASAARSYLERFPCSEARFDRVLRTKFMRHRQAVVEDWIAAAIQSGRNAGFLDDARYGQAVFEGYVRQGLPEMRIRQKLQVKQLAKGQISELLSTLPRDTETRMEALTIFARRKRLGAFNPKHPDEKDYARLRRAGFAHEDVAKFLKLTEID